MSNDILLSADLLQPYSLKNSRFVFDLRRPERYFKLNYFLGRIEFSVDGVAVGPTSANVAILGFALDLKSILNQLNQPGEVKLCSMLNEQDIRLARDESSDMIVIEPVWRDYVVIVMYQDILAAADRFLQGLLDDLSLKFPQLVENDLYPAWRAL